MSPSTVSRYLSGERPPEKFFLDLLLNSACSAIGQKVTPDMQEHLYRLHREALLAVNPARYREQMASDCLEDAILQREQAELQIDDLRVELSGHKVQLRELEFQIQQTEAVFEAERQHRGAELDLYHHQKDDLDKQCEQLRMEIQDLETALDEAVRERDAARRRCAELEAELATTEGLAEREELKRQATEERLRSAKAADMVEQQLVDLERMQREAEEVRREAVREAAAQREEAEVTAAKIIEEATSRVTKIRPSMVPRSAALRRLREAATYVAEQRLPMLVDQLSRSAPDRVDTRVIPIPIDTRDAIGDIARAFDQVQREAVRLAAEQAMLRAHVTAISTTLARRTQALIADQLDLLTDLENDEIAPERLTDLHRLDHLATRARRNAETLLILVGKEPGRRWDQPVPMIEVLLAACSEVEDYQGISLSGIPRTKIHGRVVTDLVHLLAELLENATNISPPHNNVRVAASHLPDGRVLIEIRDKGIGLTSDDYNNININLAVPPPIDTSISRGMGLFVAGQLSSRHGIRIQLGPSDEQVGTITRIMLPSCITLSGDGQMACRSTPGQQAISTLQ